MVRNETRIFHRPRQSSPSMIVSMPKTAWYWLDDLVKQQFPMGGYKALLAEFGTKAEDGCPENVSRTLKTLARKHYERKMAELYHLANDNVPTQGYDTIQSVAAHPEYPDISARLPSVYQLFRFMPHATYLTTVWERRNYHLRQGPAR